MSLINKIKQTVKLEEKLASYDGDDKIISSHELQEILDKKEENLERISSGLEHYDKLCKGFETGELIIVTGFTGNGKTSLLQTLTSNFAKEKNHTLWFSYEMPPRQFLRKFYELPLFYIPKEIKGSAINWIEEKIIEAKLKYEVKIVMIDHLHFLIDMIKMNHPSLEIGTIVRQLKTLCIKHNIVIFLVSHTTKPKGNKLPGLEDIRDSSFTTQESDCTLAIQRIKLPGGSYGPDSWLVILKHRREGVMGQKIKLTYQNNQFKEISFEQEEERSVQEEEFYDPFK
jgi:replicative DNA helicase